MENTGYFFTQRAFRRFGETVILKLKPELEQSIFISVFGVLEFGKDFWTVAAVCATACIEVRKSMFKDLKDKNLECELCWVQ